MRDRRVEDVGVSPVPASASLLKRSFDGLRGRNRRLPDTRAWTAGVPPAACRTSITTQERRSPQGRSSTMAHTAGPDGLAEAPQRRRTFCARPTGTPRRSSGKDPKPIDDDQIAGIEHSARRPAAASVLRRAAARGMIRRVCRRRSALGETLSVWPSAPRAGERRKPQPLPHLLGGAHGVSSRRSARSAAGRARRAPDARPHSRRRRCPGRPGRRSARRGWSPS